MNGQRPDGPLELTDESAVDCASRAHGEVIGNPLIFSKAELDVYGPTQLDALREVLRIGSKDRLYATGNAIARKIGRAPKNVSVRAFLEAYYHQLRAHLRNTSAPPHSKVAAGASGANGGDAYGRPNWIWWVGGLCLLLAYCNYAGEDKRSEPANANAGMSYAQVIAYRDCMGRSRWYGSDYERSGMCRRSALGLDDNLDCHTEWDGRANATICE